MPILANQKILQIADKTQNDKIPDFITEDVVEVRRARLIYYKWTCFFMSILATISLLYGVSATLVLMKLVPQIIMDVQIFAEISDSESMVKREFIYSKMESREKMMINFMKQYVELRNTYIKDELEMKKRWLWGGLVSYLSTPKVYKKFKQEYPRMIEELKRNKASRSVEILSVKRSGGEKSYVWKVEFKTYDFFYNQVDTTNSYQMENAGPEVIERYWTANIGSRPHPYRRIAYKRLINPLGFYVYHYFQAEIEN